MKVEHASRSPASHDTVAGSTPAMLDRRTWPGTVRRLETAAGEVREVWVTAVEGVSLTYHAQRGWLVAEASLPKALRGENFTLTDPGEEALALALVDERIRAMLPAAGLRPFSAWRPTRLDAVRHLRVGSRPALVAALRRLRDVEVPRWGAPVVGQALSITWGRDSGQRVRAYDKWREWREAHGATTVVHEDDDVPVSIVPGGAETAGGGDAPARDLLRVEGVLRRARVIDRLMRHPGATLAEALASGVAERPLERVWATVETIAGGADVNQLEAFNRLRKAHGAIAAMRLLGWCQMLAVSGADELGEFYGRSTVWRVMRDLRDAKVEPAAVEWETKAGAAVAKSAEAARARAVELRRRREARRASRASA